MAYYLMKVLFQQLLNLHFNEIDVLGQENIPDGPLIICSNHSNQFVDGTVIVANNKREIHFIGAAKSVKRPIIGHFLKAIKTIPVERAQDLAKKGKGKIVNIIGNQIIGENTEFLSQKEGDSIYINETKQELLIEKIESDIKMLTKNQNEILQLSRQSEYKIIPKIDQSDMYEAVWQTLKQQNAVGIFPEGGSHDRTDLLPLKAGVCIMALGAMAKYNVQVSVMACGLNYYRSDRFQSKAFIIYGKPFKITDQMLDLYRTNKRQAIQQLLLQIEAQMREVTITSPNYDYQKAIYTIRRIYCSNMKDVRSDQKIQLNQRFSKAFHVMKENEEVKQLTQQIINYNNCLSNFNIIDKNLENASSNSYFIDILLSFWYIFVELILFIFLIPGEIFIGPIQILLAHFGEQERVKALQGSTVKLEGRDVVASYKIVCSIIFIPLFCIIYSFMIFITAYFYFKQNFNTSFKYVLTFALIWPLIIYLTYKFQYVVHSIFRKIKSKFYFIFYRKQFIQLIKTRKQLQKQINFIVDKYFDQVFNEQQRVLDQSKFRKRSSFHIDQAFEVLNEIYEPNK